MALVVPTMRVSAQSGDEFDQYGRWRYRDDSEPAWFLEEAYPDDEVVEMRTMWRAIGDDPLGSDWGGDFSRAWGELGWSLFRFRPGIGYVRLTVHSCRPGVREFDYGRVEELVDEVKLTPTCTSGQPTSLVKIVWEGRRYLIESDRVAAFFEHLAGRAGVSESEMWEYVFFRREMNADPTTVTSIPEAYRSLVVSPIVCEADSVRLETGKKGQVRRVVVGLPRGTVDGVRTGMEFHFRVGTLVVSIRCRDVYRHHATAEFRVEPYEERTSVAELASDFPVGVVLTTDVERLRAEAEAEEATLRVADIESAVPEEEPEPEPEP